MYEPPIDSDAPGIVPARRESLAEAIARCPDLAARPDLVIRLVDLIFLLAPPRDTPPA